MLIPFIKAFMANFVNKSHEIHVAVWGIRVLVASRVILAILFDLFFFFLSSRASASWCWSNLTLTLLEKKNVRVADILWTAVPWQWRTSTFKKNNLGIITTHRTECWGNPQIWSIPSYGELDHEQSGGLADQWISPCWIAHLFWTGFTFTILREPRRGTRYATVGPDFEIHRKSEVSANT